ncbi:MAG: dihydrofolate reductase [Bacteroidota bacterium]
MKIILLAAHNRTLVIGRNGATPWHLPEDLKRFKALTLGHTVLMGRKTFESIGKPLSGRRNIVLSHQPFSNEGTEVFTSFADAFSSCAESENVFVIGGGEIFRQALPLADELDLTIVDNREEGDTFFPEYEHLIGKEFRLNSEEKRDGFMFRLFSRIRV